MNFGLYSFSLKSTGLYLAFYVAPILLNLQISGPTNDTI